MSRFKLKFVEGDEAIDILLNSDPYISQMSSFERGIRMRIDKDVDEDEYREHLIKQVVPWKDSEKEMVEARIFMIQGKFEELKINFNFPDQVKFLKTTGLEEIRECPGYCRRGTIVMSQRIVDYMRDSFLVHELFHIQSQFNPELRFALYEQLGFKKCQNEIKLPSDIANKKITNPDAPNLDVYISVTYKDEKVNTVPIVFYNRNGFYNKLCIKLLVVEESKEDQVWRYVTDKDGNYTLFGVTDVDDFFTQIGKTHYYIHPEEVLATRFASMVTNNKHDEFVEKMMELISS